MARLLLLPSPLTRSVAWGRLPRSLVDAGAEVAVLEPDDDDRPPFAARWVAACARQAEDAGPGPVVLVGHSGAGPLLPALGYALRAAHRPLAAYAYVDAGLPRQVPGSRLEAYAAEDPAGAAELARLLADGSRFPSWTDEDLLEVVPEPSDRAALVHGLRPRDAAYWNEPLPDLVDWPDAPCVYLRTSAGYDVALRGARLRGWPTDFLDLGHFPGFTDPATTAHALLTLLGLVVAG